MSASSPDYSMPQGVLVSACTGGPCDSRIACETLADGDPSEEDVKNDPDSPPQSFWLSKDADFDWFTENAFYERKLSTKGMAAISTNLNPTVNSSTNSPWLLTPLNRKPKASSIIGLPNPKVQKHTLDPKNRRSRKLGGTHLFLKQSGSVMKSGRGPSPTEPSSPEVSCMGTVSSRKGSKKKREPRDKPERRRKSGFLSSFESLFQSGCRDSRATAVHEPTPTAASPPRRRSTELRAGGIGERPIPRGSSVDGEPPGLGGLVRFASSRRSDSWGQF